MTAWRLSWRADPVARAIADRHYNTPIARHRRRGSTRCSAAKAATSWRPSSSARPSPRPRWRWPAAPDLGMVTFIDPAKVRRKRDPGRCYHKAGFRLVGRTRGGLLVFRLAPADMPEAAAPQPRTGQPATRPAQLDPRQANPGAQLELFTPSEAHQ